MKRLTLITAMLVVLHFPVPAFAHDEDSLPPTLMEKAISKLPHDKAEGFRDELQSAHEENENLYEQARQLHVQLHDILAADSFDRGAFNAKSQELRQLHDKIRTNLDEAFADAVSELSTSDRQTLLAALEHQEHKVHKAMKEAE